MPPACLQDMVKEDFVLPSLGSKLVALRDQVVNGTGFVLLRGLPVGQWSQDEIATAYWGIGRHWGNPQSQNRLHHLLGHVKVRVFTFRLLMYSDTVLVLQHMHCCAAMCQLWYICLLACWPQKSCWRPAALQLKPGLAHRIAWCLPAIPHHLLLAHNACLLVQDIKPPGGFKNPVNRVYATHGAQPYHTDSSDMVGE